MLVNRLPVMNYYSRMSPSRRKSSRLVWTTTGGKMGVFCATFVLAFCLNLATAQDLANFPVTVVGDDDYSGGGGHFVSRAPFKPSPLIETYYERHDDSLDDLDTAGSMQDNFLDLFIWSKPMPATSIVNTFLENENELPFLSDISKSCPRKDFFFGMNPRHMRAVQRLEDVIMEQRTPREAIKMAAALRDLGEINPHAWLRAVVSSSIHRRDMMNLRKPSMVEVMPSMFITNNVLSVMKRSVDSPSHSRRCVLVDGTVGRDNGIENLVWYWREDVMLNAHHWYWHLSYPISGSRGRQDREGELFYFMHHTMLARFHSERLSVGLPPVRPFNLQPGSRIPLAYNPHMHDGNSGNNWSARPPGVPVSDVMSDALPDAPFFISVRNRTIQLNRIIEGISLGQLIDRFGRPIFLDTDEGINLLGNTIEANAFSVNPEFYGYHGIHNNGHNIISLALDPRDELGIPPGVMGDAATAMRDVIFYPYHEYMDNLFNQYKISLQPYQLTQGDWPLLVQGVDIHSLKVHSNNLPTNVLHTFWSSRKFDLSRGLDFNRSFVQGPLWACVQHLDHQDYEYELKIERKDYAPHAKTVTVRLFMGPRYDLKGRRYTLEEERHYMFILDTFTVPLKVGMNTVRRKSVETPLTIDFPQSLRELRQERDNAMPFCGCGWPHHLLIPKGNREGLSMDIFAIITNSEEDYVEPIGTGQQQCRPAYIFCGLMDERYPDARPMGYPFDRKLFISETHGATFLENLVRAVPNAISTHVKIIHFDELRNLGDSYLGADYDFPDEESNQYLDASDHPRAAPVAHPAPEVIHIEDGPNALSSPLTRIVTSPVSIESTESHEQSGIIHGAPAPPPGPPLPPPPPPPPRTILNLRLRHPEDISGGITHEVAPNFHSSISSDSNGLETAYSGDALQVHQDIRNAIDRVNPPSPPPPPPPISPVAFTEHITPARRPYRSAFRQSFRSLLKSYSPIGSPVVSTPKSIYALLG